MKLRKISFLEKCEILKALYFRTHGSLKKLKKLGGFFVTLSITLDKNELKENKGK